jgi:2-oxoglutarate ferredoxin oxidoreductase subunit alpha
LAINRGDIAYSFNSGDFNRYKVTESGISPRALPGSGAFFITNSDEHNEVGFSNEESVNRVSQHEKRNKKVKKVILEDMKAPVIYGNENADITILSYGSNKGPILEALKRFTNVNYVHTTWMSPFPSESLKKILKEAKKIVVFECSISGQFASLIAEKTLIAPSEVVLKYDGRPFYPEDITEKLIQLGGKQ